MFMFSTQLHKIVTFLIDDYVWMLRNSCKNKLHHYVGQNRRLLPMYWTIFRIYSNNINIRKN